MYTYIGLYHSFLSSPSCFFCTLQAAAPGEAMEDRVLTERLLRLLASLPAPTTGQAPPEPLTLDSALRRPPPEARDDDRIPLTW